MKRLLILFLSFLISAFISSFFIFVISESNAGYNSLNTGAQVDAAVDHYQMKYYPDASESDQGATASGSGDTIYDILQTVGTSKYATIVLVHTGSGNTTNYTLDTSIDLTSYPYVFILFESGARLARTTGDELFTIYSTENLIISKGQQIASVDMIRFVKNGIVYPELWGAKGDNSTNDTNAITYAIDTINAAGGGKVLFLEGTYLVTGLTLKSNVHLVGMRNASIIKLNNSANADVIAASNGTSNISVFELTIDGNRTNQTSDVIQGININSSTASKSSKIEIAFCRIIDCRQHGIQTGEGTFDVDIHDNFIDGMKEGSGIECSRGDGGNTRYTVRGNLIQNVQKAGISATSDISHLTIIGNVCGVNGNQGGAAVADNITAYATGNGFITVSGNVCKSSANHGIHVTGDKVSIMNNVVDDPTQSGIFIGHSSETPYAQANFFSVIGNAISSPGLIGIHSQNVKRLTIQGNIIDTATSSGIQHSLDTTANAADHININGNTIYGCGSDGILIANGVKHGVIIGNISIGNGRDGIRISDTGTANQGIIIALNRCQNNTGWGINELNNAYENIFLGNHVDANTGGGIQLSGAGTTGASAVEAMGWRSGSSRWPDITATTSTSIPADSGELIRISASGAVTVNTITPVWPGRRLIIHFNDGNVTLAHNAGGTGTMFLNGGTNKTGTIRDIIQLVSDGSAWLQIGTLQPNG